MGSTEDRAAFMRFSDSAASFGAAVRKVFENGFPVSQRNDNLKLIARHDYDVIAKKEIINNAIRYILRVSILFYISLIIIAFNIKKPSPVKSGLDLLLYHI